MRIHFWKSPQEMLHLPLGYGKEVDGLRALLVVWSSFVSISSATAPSFDRFYDRQKTDLPQTHRSLLSGCGGLNTAGEAHIVSSLTQPKYQY